MNVAEENMIVALQTYDTVSCHIVLILLCICIFLVEIKQTAWAVSDLPALVQSTTQAHFTVMEPSLIHRWTGMSLSSLTWAKVTPSNI